MARLAQLATLVVSTLAATGCASMTAGSFVDHGADFSRYRTWDWSPSAPLPTGDRRLEADPFFQDHLQGAVEKQMAQRGFTRRKAAKADLLLQMHTNINHRID